MAGGFPGRRWLVPDGASSLQVCIALLFGSILGWTPSLVTFHCLLILVSLVFLRIPLLLVALTAALCWGIGFVGLDVVIDLLGQKLLRTPDLLSLWTWLYNAPVLPWTRFSNSMVMGATALGLLCLPLWLFLGWKLGRMARPA